ncbi:hypothetical protein GCM10007967_05570 [Xylanimonas ulmi]
MRWAEAHRFGVDVVATVALGLPTVALSVVAFGSAARFVTYESPLAALIWSTLLVVPLAWRRVRPVPATAAVAAVALAHVLTGNPLILPADFAILIALYSVTVNGPVWAHRAAMVTALGGAALLGAAMAYQAGGRAAQADLVGVTVVASIMALSAWAFGLMRRARREMLEALHDRTRRLEIERDQQAQLATAAERARIAREMHDIVAHSLSVVIAQADGGRYAAVGDPGAAGRALEVISETGRAALADMRRLLGVLRSDDGAAAPRAPQPGMSPTAATGTGAARAGATPAGQAYQPTPIAAPLDDADLGSLIDQARDAGTQVSLVRVGEPRRLPPGAGLTLHRVCQEALTNVRKHAGPGVSVTVVVRWAAAGVELEVSDDGRGAAAVDAQPGGPGYGLLGMRERAALFGGSATAGPRPGGGWRVRFAMPLPPESRPAEAGPSPTAPSPTAPAEARPAEIRPAEIRPGEATGGTGSSETTDATDATTETREPA